MFKKTLIVMLAINLKKISLTVIFVLLFSSVQAEKKVKIWSEKSCSDLYDAIGLFTFLADKEWKKKREEKAAFYTSVAADYAKIFETVCKRV